MKKKKSIIVNSVIAATVATSVFAVTNPADAASTSKAEQSVVKAEKLGGALKWEISLEYRKAKYPTSQVGYPNMKLFNDTKKALAEAKNAVAALKGKEKDVLSARLDANVALHVNRAVAYIDAVSSGLNIQKKSKELEPLLANGTVNDQTEKLYHELTREIKKNAFMLDRVYGVTTREEFRSFYKKTAEAKVSSLLYPLTVKIELDRAAAALDAGNVDEAATRLGNVPYFVKEAAAKKGQSATDKLIVGSLANQKAVSDAFNTKAALYVADSTNVAAPTVFGPASGSETIAKTVYVYVGQNEQLKLQNVSINGNLVVLGSPAGAGSVFLDNVKVNKGTEANSGKIIVQNVAEHSLNMKNVQADSLMVNDTDGYNIVADTGTKIGTLSVSEGAGATGKGTIESKEAGTIGAMNLGSKGTDKSAGTELKGNFSATNVTVSGDNAKVNLASGTEVKSIDFKAPASLEVPKDAKVGELTKSPEVPGNVNVNNQGTIEKSNSNIVVGGTPPVQVTPPSTTPGNGGGTTPPPVVTTPALTGYKAVINGADVAGANNEVNLTTVADSAIFTAVKISTNNATKLVLTKLESADYPGENLIGTKDFVSTLTLNGETSITTKMLFGPLDAGDPGVSLKGLRETFPSKTVVLKGYLQDASGNKSGEISITIKL